MQDQGCASNEEGGTLSEGISRVLDILEIVDILYLSNFKKPAVSSSEAELRSVESPSFRE